MTFFERKVLLINVLILLFAISVSANSCGKSPCCFTLKNNSIISLAPIGKKDVIPQFRYVPNPIITFENTSIEGLYFYDPCYSFSLTELEVAPPEKEKRCKNAAACKLSINDTEKGLAPLLYALGSHDQAVFHEEKDAFTIAYTLSDPPKSKTNLTVTLKCDSSVEHTLLVDKVEGSAHFMTLTSKCACPDACAPANPPDDPEKSGLSTGSALLIAFFVILIIYFVLGSTYNFCNGAHGQELIPHSAFWTDLPQLITDGFLFTCSCCKAKNQSNYNDM